MQENNSSKVDRGWNEMSDLLDSEMPTKKRRPFFWMFLSGIAIALMIVLGYFFMKDPINNSNATQKNIVLNDNSTPHETAPNLKGSKKEKLLSEPSEFEMNGNKPQVSSKSEKPSNYSATNLRTNSTDAENNIIESRGKYSESKANAKDFPQKDVGKLTSSEIHSTKLEEEEMKILNPKDNFTQKSELALSTSEEDHNKSKEENSLEKDITNSLNIAESNSSKDNKGVNLLDPLPSKEILLSYSTFDNDQTVLIETDINSAKKNFLRLSQEGRLGFNYSLENNTFLSRTSLGYGIALSSKWHLVPTVSYEYFSTEYNDSDVYRAEVNDFNETSVNQDVYNSSFPVKTNNHTFLFGINLEYGILSKFNVKGGLYYKKLVFSAQLSNDNTAFVNADRDFKSIFTSNIRQNNFELMAGLSYELNSHFSLYSNYSRDLMTYYRESNSEIIVSGISLGVSFRF